MQWCHFGLEAQNTTINLSLANLWQLSTNNCGNFVRNHQRAPNPQPNLHNPVWVGRNVTDQTHPNLQPHICVIPAIYPNLYPLAGDDRRLTLLKRGCANSVVGLEIAEANLTSKETHESRESSLSSWSGRPPNYAGTQKELKWPKSDSKVTPGSHTTMTPSDSKVIQKWLENGVRNHFWVNFGSR